MVRTSCLVHAVGVALAVLAGSGCAVAAARFGQRQVHDLVQRGAVVHTASVLASPRDVFDVTAFGAVGDGKTDDTAAFGKALAALQTAATGVLLLPVGKFLISKPLDIDANALGPVSITGQGFASMILWSFDDNLFVFRSSGQVATLSASNFMVVSTVQDKSPSSTALKFTGGLVKSEIAEVVFLGTGGIPGDATPTFQVGSSIDMGNVSDTNTVRDVLIWAQTGTAVTIGHGSEVRIIGGRFIGMTRGPSSIGVHVTGNNGGVHVVNTDLIGNNIGMLLDSSNGAGSNREIFISHATIDSNWRGLAITDSSYVSIAGCWTASSIADNIWMAPSATNALLVIAGGTIFNAGAIGGNCDSGQCNGLTVNGGSFQLTGVAIRNNKGVGVWVPNAAVSSFLLSGNKLYGNGMAVNFALSGGGYLVANNVFNDNSNASNFGSMADGAIVTDNVGVASNR